MVSTKLTTLETYHVSPVTYHAVDGQQAIQDTREMIRAGVLIVALALSAAAPHVSSQPYPTKLIRVINPVAPGGNQDIVARAYADQLARAFGQPVVVESRPGTSGTVGTRFVKSAAPDGYTLLAISNTFVRAPSMMPDAGYDAVKDFAAISMTSDVPLVLV